MFLLILFLIIQIKTYPRSLGNFSFALLEAESQREGARNDWWFWEFSQFIITFEKIRLCNLKPKFVHLPRN